MITSGSVRLRARLSAALVMASPPPPAATRIVPTSVNATRVIGRSSLGRVASGIGQS